MRNLNTSKEGWIPAANLIKLIGKSKSCQSLTSSGILRNKTVPNKSCQNPTCINSSMWLCFKQKAVALGTSAHHLAAVRPTQASLISNPENTLHFLHHQTAIIPTSCGYLYRFASICNHEFCQFSTENRSYKGNYSFMNSRITAGGSKQNVSS